jgi:hypothetical protein
MAIGSKPLMKPNIRWSCLPCLCGALLAALQMPVQAAPAPWYLWRSQFDGALACRQFSPGQAWSLHDGPFADLDCRKRIALKK